MIDVHVLTHEGTRQDWLDHCLESLQQHPCTVHVVDNAGCSVGAGRAKGYALGEHEFVAYVDSDDFVYPGCFDECLEALQFHRSVITMERVIYPDGSHFPFPKPGHNVSVYRREDVIPHIHKMAKSAHTTDHHMRRILTPHQLSLTGYAWRCHDDGDHHKVMGALDEESRNWITG